MNGQNGFSQTAQVGQSNQSGFANTMGVSGMQNCYIPNQTYTSWTYPNYWGYYGYWMPREETLRERAAIIAKGDIRKAKRIYKYLAEGK